MKRFDPQHLLAHLAVYPESQRYWVAYSGGCDSHVLLHALTRLGKDLPWLNVYAAHINHGLQAAAPAWETHCQQVCAGLGVPYTCLKVDASPAAGESPEAAARRNRYAALAGLLGPGDGLLLAQHQDDQAETLLLQLLRGAGVKGLASMPECAPFAQAWLGRPLLNFPRKALLHYAKQQGLGWIDDPSNFDTEIDRNFIRHTILPRLAERWPAAAVTLARVAQHQAEAADLLEQLARQDWQQASSTDDKGLSLQVLCSLDLARQRNLLRYWLVQQCGLLVPDTRHLNRILSEVIPAREDGMPQVRWPGAMVCRYRQRLYAMAPLPEGISGRVWPWDLQSELELREVRIRLLRRTVTGQGLQFELLGRGDISVRFRQGGERCRPVGRGGSHRLKKLFQEWGVPPWQRQRIPLLYVGEEIAQVGNYCLCEPFQAPAGAPGLCIESQNLVYS